MRKINFIDYQEPAMSANTMNTLQTNVEDAIEEVAGRIVGIGAAPIGAILAWTTGAAPTGWLVCDGSAVSRLVYASLFEVIGTTYGSGDGTTTFNLPNLKGRVVVGQDVLQTEFDTLGETGGEKTHTLTVEEMPAHKHLFKFTKEIADPATGSGEIFFGKARAWNMGDNGNITEDTGGGAAHNNLQPYITLNYIIKATKQEANTVSESLPVGTELDFDGTSSDIPEGWEEVTNPDSYSTSEVKTNKTWIDGKPIYRKVLNLGSMPSSTGNNFFNHNISNISNVIFQTGFLVDSNEWLQLNSVYRPEASVGVTFDLGLLVTHTQINITTLHNRSAYSAYVILEYTKTTD